jgi:hypothetical protein
MTGHISSRRSREQEPTKPVSVETIMRTQCFALGVADMRAGKAPRREYERWCPDDQWDYERGRQWAALAPRSVPLRRKGGKLNPVAVKLFSRGIL